MSGDRDFSTEGISPQRMKALRDSFKACMRSFNEKKSEELPSGDLHLSQGPKPTLSGEIEEPSSLQGQQMDQLKQTLSSYLDAVKQMHDLCGDHCSQEHYLECISILQSYFLFGKHRSKLNPRIKAISDTSLRKSLERVLDSFHS